MAACAAASAGAAGNRIRGPIDDQERATLPGNIHPAAADRFDQGPVDPHFPMNGLRLVLNRSAQQAAALETLMAQQLDPRSPNYHRWVSAAQFGAQFGPSDDDLGLLTAWLQSHGFSVDDVNTGRTFVSFSGSAARVAEAFRSPIHRYLVGGEGHVANSTDPSIPAALRPVVSGIASLNDFFARPLHHDMGIVTRGRGADKWQRQNAAQSSSTLFAPGAFPGFELVSPYDFATIYNVLPLWNAGIDGAGQTIAIAGRSDILLSDVATFRAAFGLPVNVPTVIVNGRDPGVPNDDEKLENTLDVEWSGAVAKGAHIILVTTASTNTADGATASASYIIDHQTASILSFSYGACELALGTSGNALYQTLWQQAAAEGISVFVASGDEGSAGCDYGGPPSYGAQSGLAVNGTSSTPYDISVGGTDLNWVNQPATSYWADGSASVASALQYIPEVPWNSSCASLAYDQWVGATGRGLDPEQYCNSLLGQGATNALALIGGGGGMSACTAPLTSSVASCAGGYAKPLWQAGIGVPADGHRDVPDVSLFAANGMLQTAYVVCDSAEAPCNYAVANDAMAQGVGGTSVASPAMAGIMALVNHKMGSPQGNANAALYALAAFDNRAACNSATVTAGNACNFYDIAADSNELPCVAGSKNCLVAHAGDRLGILSGYAATTGYDLSTGLGTVNAANLVNNWHLAATVSGTVLVPNVVGSNEATAGTVIANAGLALGTLSSQPSSTIAAGVVISESPAAGTSAQPASLVNLVISAGAQVRVPNTVGDTQSAASSSLRTAGLMLGTVTQVSACVVAGTVTSQNPAAGTLVASGIGVNLVVAAAPPKVLVPNTAGMLQSIAANALTAAGLGVGVVTRQASSTVAAGHVISESPIAGISVAACSNVNLSISSGPQIVLVPNAVNLTTGAATRALTLAGLTVGSITQLSSASVPAGRVISQNPAAGSSVGKNSAVNLVVSRSSRP